MFPPFGSGSIFDKKPKETRAATGYGHTTGEVFIPQLLLCPRCGKDKLTPKDKGGTIAAVECLSCGAVVPIEDFRPQTEPADGPIQCDLADQPEFAMALGCLAAASSASEGKLSLIAAFLLRSPPWHAHTAFFAIANNKARVDMVKALLTHMLGAEAFGPRLSALLEGVRRLAERRNKYIHGRWAMSKDKNKVFLLENAKSPSQSKYRRVNIQELTEVLDRTRESTKELARFCGDYGAAYPIQMPEPSESVIPRALHEKFSALLPRQNQGTGRRPRKK